MTEHRYGDPYEFREEAILLQKLNDLTRHHYQWCQSYQNLFSDGPAIADCIEDVPYVHVGLFKRMNMSTLAPESKVVRTVLSSSTSGVSSRVSLDERSSIEQASSAQAILASFIGSEKRPLLILDSAASLRRRDDFSARIMAALSLKPFASEIFFLLKDAQDPKSFNAEQLACALKQSDSLIVYGFSWMMWLGWAQQVLSESLKKELANKTVHFIHSGGWKKLEDIRVERTQFDSQLLSSSGAGSKVVDYYGLVEQMGVIYPLCEYGARHIPKWADVLIRDSWTGNVMKDGVGQIQLLNSISYGSPCHSVLTEDMGRILKGTCKCGRTGPIFELVGRVPKAEIRGCANV